MTVPGGRATLKRALRSYVAGHDRGWSVDRKRQTGGIHRQDPTAPTFDEPAARSERVVGVPVPERLDFHRGPDTWRSRERGTAGEGGRG